MNNRNKTAILTLPLRNNYGGVLQAYALQKVLSRYCKDVVIYNLVENYNYKRSLNSYLVILYRFLKKIIGDSNVIYCDAGKQMHFLNTPQCNFRNFINAYIQVINVSEYTENLFINNNIDKIIVGSDQVWRKEYSSNVMNFFCSFIKRSNIEVASYAASLGTSDWCFSQYETRSIAERLQRFNYVAVRESSSVDHLFNNCKIKSELVLDPTLLLEKEDYLKLLNINKHTHTKIPGKKLGVYVLDWSTDKDRIISSIANDLQLDVVYIGKPSKKGFPSIESWLQAFNDFDLIFTDSYHGTLFSLIFNVNFMTYINNGRGNARFDTIFELFDIKTKGVHSFDDFKIRKDVLYKRPDFVFINQKRRSLKDVSLAFISKLYENK